MWGSGIIWSNNLSSTLTLQDSQYAHKSLRQWYKNVRSNLYTISHMFGSIEISSSFLSCPFYWGFLSCNSRRCINVCLWCNPINWNSLLWCLYRFIIERRKRIYSIRTCLWDLFFYWSWSVIVVDEIYYFLQRNYALNF